MKRIKEIILASALAFGFAAVAVPVTVEAQGARNPCELGALSQACRDQPSDARSVVNTIINVLLWAIGVIAVIFIIIGGIQFVTSNGDPAKTKTARSTILYAVIGLVVAILAYAAVRMIIRLNWS